MTEEQAIAIWKEEGITHAEFDFNCGGDSMNDTTLFIYNSKGEVSLPALENYLENAIYDNVAFYENSNGYYIGESGTVTITLEDGFVYDKQSEGEYHESYENVEVLEVSQETIDFIKEYVLNMVGGSDGERINFKKDFFLDDKKQAILEKLETDLEDFATNYEPKHEGELSDWYQYSAEIVDDKLTVTFNHSACVYRQE